MTPNKTAQRESTLLAVIAQAHARGASYDDVERYVMELKMPSSKVLVERLFHKAQYSAEPSTLKRWAATLALNQQD